MKLTRRQFILGGAAGLGTLASPAFARLNQPLEQTHPDTLDKASAAYWVLGRIGYGATPWGREEYVRSGIKRYLEEQLHPSAAEDTVCNDCLERATLPIEYKDGDGYKGLAEDRPLHALNAPVEALWKLTDNANKMDGKERHRPAQEVRAATWIRAVHSRWQLNEVMAEFWHNHFSVNAFSDPHIAASFPLYDAALRQHCFGNFRAMLEDVARSAAMLYYLNNVKSRASPANENYARELFELHTLGADHYYNNLYNRWREVPGALAGKPIGYIDEDVYEAARAFTGWTVEDGSNTGRGTIFPQTGKFTYFDGWHDNYQKRVLGTEFDPNAPPMADGKKVLDLVAAHPGTAIHLCTKLCRRLVADNPPPALVKKAAGIWRKNLKHPEQIKQVLRAIILSPEFAGSEGRKVKRPFEYAVSFLRATQAGVMPNEPLFNHVSSAGYRQFEWPTPTGHPDRADDWLNSNSTLTCWNLAANLLNPGFKAASVDLQQQTPSHVRTSREIVYYWTQRLTGKWPDETLCGELMQYMPHPDDPGFVPDIRHPSFKEPLHQMVMTVAMLPDFQIR